MKCGHKNKQKRFWGSPGTDSDFKYEFSIASEPVAFYGLEANPVFSYLLNHGLEVSLYLALDKLAPLLPVQGFREITTHWYSPPPAGFGNRVIIVITKDINGKHHIFGSNFICIRPSPSGKPKPSNLFRQIRNCFTDDQKNVLLAETINAVITPEWLSAIRQVETEAERFRTMPIYLAIATEAKESFYCTTARAEIFGHPANFDLEIVDEFPFQNLRGAGSSTKLKKISK